MKNQFTYIVIMVQDNMLCFFKFFQCIEYGNFKLTVHLPKFHINVLTYSAYLIMTFIYDTDHTKYVSFQVS